MVDYTSTNTGTGIDAAVDRVQAVSGDLIGSSDAQTLTNKTLGIAGDITGTGNINITGTVDSTGAITTTASSGAAILKAESNDTIGRLHLDGSSASGDVTQIRLDLDGVAQAYMGTRTTGDWYTYVNGADAMTIDSSQNVTIPAGDLTVSAGDVGIGGAPEKALTVIGATAESLLDSSTNGNVAVSLYRARGASGTASTGGIYYQGHETPASRFLGFSTDASTYEAQLYDNGNFVLNNGNLTAPGILVNDSTTLDTDTYFQIEDAANAFAKIKSTSTGQAKLFLDSPVDPVLHLAVSGTNKWSIFSDVSETNEFNIFNNAAGNSALEIDSTSNLTVPSGDLTVSAGNITAQSGDISGGIFTESHATSHTLTNTECFGAVYYVTGAATLTLPAVEDGMSLTVITIGAVAVSVDPNASDKIWLDGTALDDGDKITNLSTAGDIAVLTYYSADGWHASTNGWSDGGA